MVRRFIVSALTVVSRRGRTVAVVVGGLALVALVGTLLTGGGDPAPPDPVPQAPVVTRPTTTLPDVTLAADGAETFRQLAAETDTRFAGLSDRLADGLGADVCAMARASGTDTEFDAMVASLWVRLDADVRERLFEDDPGGLDLVARTVLSAYCEDEPRRLDLDR